MCADDCLHASQIITPYHIYFNAWLILQKLEVWRLLSNFFYFGSLGARPHAAVSLRFAPA